MVIKITTIGHSAHSSIPFFGKNAIGMMSKIIQNLEKLSIELIKNAKILPSLNYNKLNELITPALNELRQNKSSTNAESFIENIIKSIGQFTYSVNIIRDITVIRNFIDLSFL